MNCFRNRSIWTSVTIISFLLVAISGSLMLLKLAPLSLKAIHEVFSIFFLVGSILHIACNWEKFQTYFRFKSVVALTALIIIAIPVAYFTANRTFAFSHHYVLRLIENGEVHVVGQLFRLSEAQILSSLEQSHIECRSVHQTLGEIGSLNNIGALEVIESLAVATLGTN